AVYFYCFAVLDEAYPHSYGWVVYLLFNTKFNITCHTAAMWLTVSNYFCLSILFCVTQCGTLVIFVSNKFYFAGFCFYTIYLSRSKIFMVLVKKFICRIYAGSRWDCKTWKTMYKLTDDIEG